MNRFAVSVVLQNGDRIEHELRIIEAGSPDAAEARVMSEGLARGRELLGLLHMPCDVILEPTALAG